MPYKTVQLAYTCTLFLPFDAPLLPKEKTFQRQCLLITSTGHLGSHHSDHLLLIYKPVNGLVSYPGSSQLLNNTIKTREPGKTYHVSDVTGRSDLIWFHLN